MKNFAMIGAAGYVAPRHMEAIRDTGNHLLAALDKFDSVGVIDRYFPKADFFTEFERFDRHLEKLKRNRVQLDYLSVCTPNYLHDAHIRFGLRHGAHVICEKPLVLNPWNVEALAEMEAETGCRVFNILQLRYHPSVIALREMVQQAPADQRFSIQLSYIAPRGNWYYASWKGNTQQSGGIATNIGIHFFDMLLWIFGAVQESLVHVHSHDRASGYLSLDRADVQWFLSINPETLPPEAGGTTYRALTINDQPFEFSQGFESLHTTSYEAILKGDGFGIQAVQPSIALVHAIRNTDPVGLTEHYHPLAALPLSVHPFSKKP